VEQGAWKRGSQMEAIPDAGSAAGGADGIPLVKGLSLRWRMPDGLYFPDFALTLSEAGSYTFSKPLHADLFPNRMSVSLSSDRDSDFTDRSGFRPKRWRTLVDGAA
jgi:hypothetical protein